MGAGNENRRVNAISHWRHWMSSTNVPDKIHDQSDSVPINGAYGVAKIDRLIDEIITEYAMSLELEQQAKKSKDVFRAIHRKIYAINNGALLSETTKAVADEIFEFLTILKYDNPSAVNDLIASISREDPGFFDE